MTKVNLIYSNTSLPFFNTLNVVTEELQRQKTDEVQINDRDENEIGRGNSYAFFDELKN